MNIHSKRVDNVPSQSGVALIEVMISFLVMAVGILALLSFHNASQTNIAEAKTQSEAVSLAEDKLHELESFLSADEALDSRLTAGDTDTLTGVTTDFVRTWTIETDSGDPPLKTVEVSVAWTDRNGDAQTVTISSQIEMKDPPKNSQDLIDALVGAAAIRRIYEDGGSTPWVIPGQESVPGDRQVVERIPNDLYEGEIPEDYEYENVYIFRIYVGGNINRSQGATGDVDITDVQADLALIESIDGVSGNQYEPSCTSGTQNYQCELYYISTYSGWTGSIGFTLRDSDVFCGYQAIIGEEFAPWTSYGSWSEDGPNGQLSLSGLPVGLTFHVTIAKNACG